MLDFSKASEWKIIETIFDPNALGKVEVNFCWDFVPLLRSSTGAKPVICWWQVPLTAFPPRKSPSCLTLLM